LIVTFEFGGTAGKQLRGIVNLQPDTLPAGKFRTGIQQMRFAAAGSAPESDLVFTTAQYQCPETRDDEPRSRIDVVVETELAVERQR